MYISCCYFRRRHEKQQQQQQQLQWSRVKCNLQVGLKIRRISRIFDKKFLRDVTAVPPPLDPHYDYCGIFHAGVKALIGS